MIGLLHGYLLEGSGSNLWTRCIVESLCKQGIDVALVCQEPHPEQYDCIAEAYFHHLDGSVETMLMRDTPHRGKCVMHKPDLGSLLPVFVWDKYEEFSNVVPMINLPDEALEDYVERNVAVVLDVVRRHDLTALHANHAALMAVVVQRVKDEIGIPYTVMPHGSELEYAIKKDVRFRDMAIDAMREAGKIFVHGAEMKDRFAKALGDLPELEAKFSTLPLGVHTSQFEPVPRERRREKIGRLLFELASMPRATSYDMKSPDADLEDKLQLVDWEHDAVLLFVGRLISAKGIQEGIAALPLLLAEDPGIRLIVVGHGPLRAPMEAWLAALERGDRAGANHIVDFGREMEGDPNGDATHKSLGKVRTFLDDLATRGELDHYYELAREHIRADRVIFTGYLTHTELQYLFPCCDAGIFPSAVKEAGPLVFLEALASGCFPLGTYFGGMQASIDNIADLFPEFIVDAMKLNPRDTVADLVKNVATAVRFGVRYKDVLSRTAQERFDWASVGRRLSDTLDEIGSENAARLPRIPAGR